MRIAIENNSKIVGMFGILAAIVYILTMFIAVLTTTGFDIGLNNMKELGVVSVYKVGCVIAGLLGMIFGTCVLVRNLKSNVFIGKIYGMCMILAGLLLLVLGIVGFQNDLVYYTFMALVIIAVFANAGYYWVTNQEILTFVTVLFAIIIAITALTNTVMGFGFAIVLPIWLLVEGLLFYLETEVEIPDKKKSKVTATKKNEPKPKPYPVKACVQTKQAETTKKKFEENKEQPKRAAVKAKKSTSVLVADAVVVEPKKDTPKIKVMSSRDAAAARDSRKKEEVVKAKEESVVVVSLKEELVKEEFVSTVKEDPILAREELLSIVKEEPISDSDVIAVGSAEEVGKIEGVGEEYDEGFFEDAPDALVRRATWNKGLRCRRDYGEHKIPVAFVKGKVAVYVVAYKTDSPVYDVLRSEGWTVLRFLETEITDGKIQGEVISKAVKENLKAERVSKKKNITRK